MACAEIVGKVYSIRTIWILYVSLLSSTLTLKLLYKLGINFFKNNIEIYNNI